MEKELSAVHLAISCSIHLREFAITFQRGHDVDVAALHLHCFAERSDAVAERADRNINPHGDEHFSKLRPRNDVAETYGSHANDREVDSVNLCHILQIHK